MTDRPHRTPKEVLPAATASRLLGRASELDMVLNDGPTLDQLRAASAEAGISSRAFEAALAELRSTGRASTLEASARYRRRARFAVAAAGLALVVATGVLAVVRAPAPPQAAKAMTRATSPDFVATSGPAEIVVRSADGGAAVTMEVKQNGSLFAALGVASDNDGRRVGLVNLTSAGGTATTPAALDVSGEAGVVEFSVPAGSSELELTVPGTTTQARGHTVRLVRDRAGGPLRAEGAAPPRSGVR